MNQVGERQKLEMLEVLIAVEKEARTRKWFIEDKKEATQCLLQIGFIEEDKSYPGALPPQPFCLTVGGGAFLGNVRARIGANGNINWHRLNEIEFPALEGQQTMLNEQDSRELEIFSLFAEVCPLAIRADSIEKRQPLEPDILCETSEGSVAFEMGESIDQEFARQVADIVIQVQLEEAFRNLPANDRSELRNRLGNARVTVLWQPQVSKQKRKNAIPLILRSLQQVDPSFRRTHRPGAKLCKVVEGVIVVPDNSRGGPYFDQSPSGWIEDTTRNLMCNS